jgi:hypothetical protein
MRHLKTWAPSGTRIFAFVQGPVTLDYSEVKDAQALLPLPSPAAMLMIFRMKGHSKDRPVLTCDGGAVVPIGEKQYATLQVVPGKHTCRVGDRQPVELMADAGEEYFFHLQRGTMADSWDLKPVTTSEGEDSIANLEEVSEPLEVKSQASGVSN